MFIFSAQFYLIYDRPNQNYKKKHNQNNRSTVGQDDVALLCMCCCDSRFLLGYKKKVREECDLGFRIKPLFD